jgi:hypothetical protein
MAARQRGRGQPVRGGALAVEQARRCQHEGARAHRSDARAACCRGLQGDDQHARQRRLEIGHAGHEHGAGARELLEPVRHVQVEVGRAHAALHAAHAHAVGGPPALELDPGEQLAGPG